MRIASQPAGAEIRVDGNLLGKTDTTVLVKLGQHQLQLNLLGFVSRTAELMVESGKGELSVEPFVLEATAPVRILAKNSIGMTLVMVPEYD